jgi:SAM-dependent methyltransferase
MAQNAPWWSQRYSDAARIDAAFSGSLDLLAEAQVDLIEQLLGGTSGMRVLDLGCGGGRHSILLQERGVQVVGVDLSQDLLDLAESRWRSRHPNGDVPGPTWVAGDMRRPPVAGPFGGALLLDATLGVFDDDVDHLRTLTAVADRLAPGGKLVIELLNPYFWAHHAVTRHYPPGSLAAGEDLVRTYRFDGARGRVEDRLTVFSAEGRRELPTQSLRCWTPPEIRALCTAAGFRNVEVFGSEGWQVPSPPLRLDARSAAFLWVTAEL